MREELAVCEAFGISHSYYLGGPQRWTPLDRVKAVEYREWKAAHCPGCGTRKEEWDEELGGHRHAYIAESERCPGCEIKEQLQEQIPKHARGVYVGLVPNPALLDGSIQAAVDEALRDAGLVTSGG